MGAVAVCPRLCYMLTVEAAVIKMLNKFIKEDTAATAVEYGMLIAFIAIAITTALSVLGTTLVQGWIQPIVDSMNSAS